MALRNKRDINSQLTNLLPLHTRIEKKKHTKKSKQIAASLLNSNRIVWKCQLFTFSTESKIVSSHRAVFQYDIFMNVFHFIIIIISIV